MKKIAILTGAGISAESGISTFSLDGTTFMNKSRFIPYLVKKYLEQNPSLTFAELQKSSLIHFLIPTSED